ncbi:hypothetical protein COT93_02705 [Candidatus Falkowbacteria bacterium CG10_big_fil_rev_8_21_14_0_10_37_18]|uniref:Uncharacterized protein n=1 Tax=Candidatus Falkowbacteria bacterium CG10_big_fil_rev_8_21_14_0_10_37_18 TaxID=1974562 RepID=A0A2H0VAI4_9BACT|nr:MAG: hypothetical protein AUJ26_00335 [Candidatus Falkowbacteria bacterium CG1_02_37_21]PIR95379.1 MAG: hypothetical protein COT93_02705 [Candidatus Falkowbacteria bacterium CG10_big_fil_rev_8_21_14_0_10_37_18]
MFDYLQQFNNLSKDLRDQVSSPSALTLISQLENKYRVDLAMLVMKVMIKSISLQNLPAYFVSENGLSLEMATALTRELKEKILAPVAEHLGLSTEKIAWDLDKDIANFIKEAGLVLPSAVLVGRFKNILATYLRGVRSKIDTRNSLSKDVKIGGLNLNDEEIGRILKICERHHFVNLDLKGVDEQRNISASAPTPTPAPVSSPKPDQTLTRALPPHPSQLPSAIVSPSQIAVRDSQPSSLSRLDKIIAAADQGGEYDLKKSLAQKPAPKLNETGVKLDLQHELSTPKEQLDLPLAKKSGDHASPVPVATLPLTTAAKINKPEGIFRRFFASKLKPLRPKVQPAIKPIVKPAVKPVVLPELKPVIKTATISNDRPAPAPITKSSVLKSQVPIPPVPPIQAIKPIQAIQPTKVFPTAARPNTQISPNRPQPAVASTGLKAKPITVASRPVTPASTRPQMHDIKPVPKVMGPIEELQFLDVVNFRRLGTTPEEITGKILGKIKLLERDGYDKMVKGVYAWRQSPVNRLYLRLGQEAVTTGIPFKDAIAARQAVNKEYLNMAEVEAIVGLNSKLSF